MNASRTISSQAHREPNSGRECPASYSHSPVSSSGWRAIPGYEGLYEVSHAGQVRSAQTGRVLSQFKTSGGYLIVKLFKGNVGKNHKVHRLVASAFIRVSGDGEQVNHKDLNKENNEVGNLEWVSPKENFRHFLATPAGEDWKEANWKLSVDQVEEIRLLRGVQTMQKTADQFGISTTHVCDIQNGNFHPSASGRGDYPTPPVADSGSAMHPPVADPRPIPAPVAQRKEQEHPTLPAAGSNPAGRSIRFYDGFVEPKSEVWRRA